MTSHCALEIHALEKRFLPHAGIGPLSLQFEANCMHGIIGPEGAGKTTLMRLIAGLLKPTQGKIDYHLNGEKIPFEEMRALIAYMPEKHSLYADLSIMEHLDFFAKLYNLSSLEFSQKSEALLHMTRLERFKDRPAGQLSGGMYKKLGLMCALLRGPKILLLDEPTNGVDPISRREFWELLYELNAKGHLILITTAYMDEAERCMKAHILQSGQLMASGTPHQLLSQNQVKDFAELFAQMSKPKTAAGET